MFCALQGRSLRLVLEQRTILFLQHQQRCRLSQGLLLTVQFALKLHIGLLQFTDLPERSPGDCQPCRRRKSPRPTARDDGQTNPAHDTTRSGLRRPTRGSHAKPPAALPATSLLDVLRVRSPSSDPPWRYLSSTSLRSVHSCSIRRPRIRLYGFRG